MRRTISNLVSDKSEFAYAGGVISQQTGANITTGNGELKINPGAGTYAYINVCSFAGEDGVYNESGNKPAMNVATLYSAADYKFMSLPASGHEIFAMTWVPTSAYVLQVHITSAGKIAVYDSNSALVATGTTTISAGTFYRIEFKSVVGATGAYEVRINGTVEPNLSGTCNQGTTNINAFCLINGLVNQAGLDFRYKNIIISDTGYPASTTVVVSALFPNGAGTSAWTGAYTDVDDWITGDNDGITTKVFSTANAQTFLALLQDSSVPGITGAIKSVTVLASTAEVTSGNSSSYALGISDGSTQDIGATIVASATGFLPAGKVYTQNPLTSAAFTTNDLDGLQVLIKSLSASATNLTAIGIIVEYDPGGSPAPTLTQISPTHDAQGHSGTMTFTGTNFNIAGLAVTAQAGFTWGSPASITPTSFTATYTIDVSATTGVRNITVSTNGGMSTSKPFTVDAGIGAPTVASCSPAASFQEAFSLQLTLTLTGTNLNGTTPTITNVPAGWTFGTPSPGGGGTTATVTLTLPANPSLGGHNFTYNTVQGTSGNIVFTINNPSAVTAFPNDLNGGFPY